MTPTQSHRGVAKQSFMNAHLRGVIADYKKAYPDTVPMMFPKNVVCGVDLAQGKDQTVTYTYDGKVHTAKIQQQTT